MNGQNSKTKLEDLDLFSLLKLEHLSPEEKAQRIAEIQEIVLTQFFEEDLPNLLSPEDMKIFESMAANTDPSRAEEINNFLRSKIPGLDKLIFEKMLAAKKEIVKQNILTRLDVNAKELSDPDVQKDQEKIEEVIREKQTLQDIIQAINSDDWAKASNLISTL